MFEIHNFSLDRCHFNKLFCRFIYIVQRDDPSYDKINKTRYYDIAKNTNDALGNIIVRGYYIGEVSKIEWVPDANETLADFLPHNRTQKCHFALRLMPPLPSLYVGAIAKRKQVIAYGFETTFTFRVLHVTESCLISDVDGRGYDSQWCYRRMADGFKKWIITKQN